MADPKTGTAERKRLPLVVVRHSSEVRPHRWRWRAVLRRARFIPVIIALVALGGFIGLYFQPPGLQKLMAALQLQPGGGTSSPIALPVQRPDPRQVGAADLPTRQMVVGLGRLLPEGEVVIVAPPFGAGDARVASLKVTEGDRVEHGSVLAVLDSERTLLAAIGSARAQLAAREANLAQVRASVQASRDEAGATLARAETTYQNTVREFERVEILRQRGYAAEQSFDQRRAARDEAAREVERARATLSRYGSGDLDAQADVRVAERNVDTARADLARAQADLDKAYVRAPITGTVLTVHVRPGEKPGAQGLMNLGNIDSMTVEVEVYQAQVGRVLVGDSVEVTAEALPQRLKGSVTRIGLEVGRQTVVDANPAANTDARVVKITVALETDSSSLAQRFTNLQVTARIASRGEL
ncbi:HlyD family efflux transporter periplasmic adaptor subunit [Microvirga aerilata]|uniref:HlyD family efflux transporter periplasmic adaptor subunit n=2 Tax=Microvirga aerilata TaxID=670292 RepID=A0A937D0Q3_9HYPH|nr:HlyD family efflux transporter periplasmic adaptor subunit [Microvirga aerilata]MBL0407969.1 HlyD family efflux transporter periplasmic adaptor subunit [Microvirga aerilata]